MTDQAIRVRGLRKNYPRFALKDVDLDVPRGFVTGLIGPNGAGKTTLIKPIMNLVRREAGTIMVLGLDNLADEVAVKSVLFSTHITSDLERVADYVTFIRAGSVVFTLPKGGVRAAGLRSTRCIIPQVVSGPHCSRRPRPGLSA